MSAFLVSHATVDVVVTLGRALGLVPEHHASRIGHAILRTNVESVCARYDDRDRAVQETYARDYTFTRRDVDPIVAAKQARCIAYQSCEHEGWDLSYAALLTRAIDVWARATMGEDYQGSVGYHAAPWGIEPEAGPDEPDQADAAMRY